MKEIGDFRLLQPLEESGRGQSYLALQKSLGRKVVLHLFPGAHGEEARKFQEEAERLASLDDPRIITAHGFGVEDEIFYYATDQVSGISLADLIGLARKEKEAACLRSVMEIDASLLAPQWRGERCYWKAALRLMRQVCATVFFIHQRGIIHRNLRPENIIIGTDGVLRITGFGLARTGLEQSLSRVTEKFGDFVYASPEQRLAEKPVDLRSDLYSLGVILFELLTLQRPYGGCVDRAEVPPSIRSVDPRLPRDLDSIIQGALELHPRDRYMRAVEMAGDLRAVLEGDPVSRRAVTTIAKIWRSARRSPGLVVGAGLTFLFLLGACLSWMGPEVMPDKKSAMLAAEAKNTLERKAAMEMQAPPGRALPERFSRKDWKRAERQVREMQRRRQ